MNFSHFLRPEISVTTYCIRFLALVHFHQNFSLFSSFSSECFALNLIILFFFAFKPFNASFHSLCVFLFSLFSLAHRRLFTLCYTFFVSCVYNQKIARPTFIISSLLDHHPKIVFVSISPPSPVALQRTTRPFKSNAAHHTQSTRRCSR